MAKRIRITPERLRELLHYNPETGVFTWLKPTSNRVRIGQRAGCDGGEHGWVIRLDGELYHASQLAWLYITGKWPTLHIWRRNDCLLDLRWSNLYEAPRSEAAKKSRPRASGMALTAKRLRALMRYDPDTGVFTRRVSLSRRTYVGATAGSVNDRGYVLITVDGKIYRAQHLAWLYVYGGWPSSRLDHRDTDRANNRITNLRPATNAQNLANRGPPRNNTSGYKGIYWLKRQQKWLAKIVKDGHQYHLGLFDTPEEAHAAYRDGAERLNGEFARTE